MTENTQTPETQTRGPNGFAEAKKKANLSRKTLRAGARKARRVKLQANKEFAVGFFDGKSKRSKAKKVAYKKRHAKKTA